MPCRFYGKHQLRGGRLVDQLGNQCAAITTAYSPCLMEIAGGPPEEKACDLAQAANRAQPPHGGAGVVIIRDPRQ